ncbi:MAG: dTDP-4-dehydrorhamnose reductase [Bernardetiaceae bacterium]|nr:dTDP-4-dehydrorhamnose reductase [Bernardetiaceae bacterium]
MIKANILVTGANGQLGQALQKIAKNYPFSFHFANADTLDITDSKAVAQLFDMKPFDFCINAAAYTAVDKAESEKLDCYEVNVLGVTNLAKACLQHNVVCLHISTDFVFDGQKSSPYTEEDQTNPIGVYAQSKLQGERTLLKHQPKSLILRTSWLYSEYRKNFVKTVLQLVKKQNKIRIVADQIGSPTYAGDLAAALLQIIEQIHEKEVENQNIWGIYHYCNEGVASWYDLAKAVLYMESIPTTVTPILSEDYPTPAQRPKYSVLNNHKIKDTFNLHIPYWRNSLQQCLGYLEEEEVY